jgi:tRNA pseudouridine38-40 synthase
MPTYRIDLAYDGTDFHGYARQDNVPTIQAALEAALFRRTGVVVTSVAGRTDRGVHATGQVVSFTVGDPIDADRLWRSLNRQLGPAIAVNGVVEAGDDFHARFSAVGRRYRYLILNEPVHRPLAARTSWHVAEALDVAAMDRGIGYVVGAHDFASFCKKTPGRSTIREVSEARWDAAGGFVELSIAANAFCHHMVRSIVSTSVEIGRGRLRPEAMRDILEARDRTRATGTAPALGLTLVSVDYPPVLGTGDVTEDVVGPHTETADRTASF